MVHFNSATQKYQLVLDEAIFRRLRLVDGQGHPLQILHADPVLLGDLELEILDRYRVREMTWQRDHREERWLDLASMPLLLIVLFGPLFSGQLSTWSGIPEAFLTVWFLVLLALGYLTFYWFTGRHDRPDAEAALIEDLQLAHWIRQHCRA